MSRTRRTDLLATAVVVVALVCSGCGSDQDAGAPPPTASVPTPSHAWSLNGDGKAEVGSVPLTLTGRYTRGDEAVSFDGGTGFAATSAPGPVKTTGAFTFAVWVTLGAPALGGKTVFASAVSQLGDQAAAFYLGVAEGAWSFGMKDADTNDPGHTIRALGNAAATDEKGWVHLVGVYDARDSEIRLYVDGAPAAGTAFTGAWSADGPLTIGRSQSHSAPDDFWPGAIGDVRVFTTALDGRDVRHLAEGTRPASPPPARPKAPPSALLPVHVYARGGLAGDLCGIHTGGGGRGRLSGRPLDIHAIHRRAVGAVFRC